jgi:hypothetical protein
MKSSESLLSDGNAVVIRQNVETLIITRHAQVAVNDVELASGCNQTQGIFSCVCLDDLVSGTLKMSRYCGAQVSYLQL